MTLARWYVVQALFAVTLACGGLAALTVLDLTTPLGGPVSVGQVLGVSVMLAWCLPCPSLVDGDR